MIYLTSTRFNNSTWEQNCLFREKGKIEGCIYGVPRRIPEKIEATHSVKEEKQMSEGKEIEEKTGETISNEKEIPEAQILEEKQEK